MSKNNPVVNMELSVHNNGFWFLYIKRTNKSRMYYRKNHHPRLKLLQVLQAKLIWPDDGLVLKQEWVGGALYNLLQFYDGSRHYERCNDPDGNPILRPGLTLQEYYDAEEF